MNEDKYYEYKESLIENIKQLELQQEELQDELDEIEDKDSLAALNLQLRIDTIDGDLEDDRYELRKLGSSYQEYITDAKESYEYEQWEDMERC